MTQAREILVSIIAEALQSLPIPAPSQQRPDLVVVAEERNVKFGASVSPEALQVGPAELQGIGALLSHSTVFSNLRASFSPAK
jgi:hypothetical protein